MRKKDFMSTRDLVIVLYIVSAGCFAKKPVGGNSWNKRYCTRYT